MGTITPIKINIKQPQLLIPPYSYSQICFYISIICSCHMGHSCGLLVCTCTCTMVTKEIYRLKCMQHENIKSICKCNMKKLPQPTIILSWTVLYPLTLISCTCLITCALLTSLTFLMTLQCDRGKR